MPPKTISPEVDSVLRYAASLHADEGTAGTVTIPRITTATEQPLKPDLPFEARISAVEQTLTTRMLNLERAMQGDYSPAHRQRLDAAISAAALTVGSGIAIWGAWIGDHVISGFGLIIAAGSLIHASGR